MARQDRLRHGRHADRVGAERARRRGSRPASRSSARRTRCRRRRGSVMLAAPRRRQQLRDQRGIVGVDHVDEAVVAAVSPNSGLAPVKLMWSVISISEPGGMSGRRLPAALVWSSVSQPSAGHGADRRPSSRRRGRARSSARGRAGRRPASADMAQHQLAGMAADAGRGKARQLGVGDGGDGLRPRRRSRRGRSRGRRPPSAGSPAPALLSALAAITSFMAWRDGAGRRTSAGAAPRVTVRRRPSGPQRWIGRSSGGELAQLLAAAAARRDDLGPGRRRRRIRRCACWPAATMAAMADVSAHSPADRPRSRRCSRHGSRRPRRAPPRRRGTSNRARGRAASSRRARCSRSSISAPSRRGRRPPWAGRRGR